MSAESSRQQRGREMAGRLLIVKNPSGTWEVPSESSSKKYIVHNNAEKPTCTCPDFELNQKACKHIYAVHTVVLAQQTPAPETAPEPGPVKAKKPTYKQVWPAYNAAQISEKHRFQVLLFEMCRGIEEPLRDRPKGGRPPARLADVIFAACFKVYSTFSGRHFMCDLQDAQERGYLTKIIHYNTIFAYLENEELTRVLRALVTVSSLPLKTVEVDFATDSSGFATSRFTRWFDEKYGKVRQKAQWVKAHVTVGVKTNIFTAVEIHAPDAGDAPQYPSLIEATARNFTIRESSADKAYSSVANLQATVDLGATPYIPFKSNATEEQGGLWGKMFSYFCEHRDDFMPNYHKRSNVESSFSGIKAKFGDSVRSKTNTAMVNEVLCKIIGYNICCVIQEMHELGIDPVFWEDGWAEEEEEAGEPAMILKFGTR